MCQRECVHLWEWAPVFIDVCVFCVSQGVCLYVWVHCLTVCVPPPPTGIIHPPPDFKPIIDKTAEFVARNGQDFAKKVMQKEATNLKFQFMFENNPYHAYYQFKIQEFQHKISLEKHGLCGLTPSSCGGTLLPVSRMCGYAS